MAFDTIVKDTQMLSRPPNLIDSAETRAGFSWERAAKALPHPPHGKGINLAYLTVDRHLRGGRARHAALRFVDGKGQTAGSYPENPNGSPDGLTGFTTPDGRATILMPHPERVFRTVQMSWRDPALNEDSPWMRMFRNARQWVG